MIIFCISLSFFLLSLLTLVIYRLHSIMLCYLYQAGRDEASLREIDGLRQQNNSVSNQLEDERQRTMQVTNLAVNDWRYTLQLPYCLDKESII
jgi:hypothetical protein